ncbi:MAG TPA: hypothetical protein VL381_04290 [Rhodocyclaceae bacterium]|nr:hypothetical protein [Rhodocyclaceae bacterium]
MLKSIALLLLPLTLLLGGCDQLGLETPAQTSARQEAEGKAIGGACRQAGWALQDCYLSSPKTSKAAIFNGWRDMDGYMRENKLETVTPQVSPGANSKPRKSKAEETDEAEAPAEKPAEKAAPAETPAEPPAEKGKSANKRS